MNQKQQVRLDLGGALPDNTLSPMAIGKQLVDFSRELRQCFKDIESIELLQNKPQGKISLDDPDAATRLGELIFIKNRYDLQKKVKDQKISSDFVPFRGLIHATISFYSDDKQIADFGLSAASESIYSGVDTMLPGSVFFMDYSSTSYFFQTFIRHFDPPQAYIQYIDNDFASRVSCKHYFRYGWMSYVSNESSRKIPTDLPYLEYQPFANGTLHILTRENFHDDCEKYEAQLTEIYKQSALKNPELIRTFRSTI